MNTALTQTAPWIVLLDGAPEGHYATRAQAREFAGWLSRHPSTQDNRIHGPYRNASGSVRVVRADELAAERAEERAS